jgi:hypothetical protein
MCCFLAWMVDAMETGRCGGRACVREGGVDRRARVGRVRARVVRDDERRDETDGLIE